MERQKFNRNFFRYLNGKITVIVSSVWEGAQWNPKWLFNGKTATSDQQGWASGKELQPYIEIHFDNPVSANYLTITARTNSLEHPTSFEIYGGQDSSNFIKLCEYDNLTWQVSQEKGFFFINDVAYKVYKIKILTVSGSPHPCVSFTKLNLGKIENSL